MNSTEYLTEFFGVIDRMDAQGFATYFEPAGSFRFANNAPAEGRVAIQAVAQSVFDHLTGIGHRVTATASSGGSTLMVEGVVTYHRRDGKVVPLGFACVFEFAADSFTSGAASAGSSGVAWPLIRSYRSYIDIAPLLS